LRCTRLIHIGRRENIKSKESEERERERKKREKTRTSKGIIMVICVEYIICYNMLLLNVWGNVVGWY